MQFLANVITTIVVFIVLALVIMPMIPEFGLSLICISALSAFIILSGLYFWQPDQPLGQLDVKGSLLAFVVAVCIYVPILAIVSLIFAHLNPFVPAQWHKFHTALTYFFVGSIGSLFGVTGAVLVLPLLFATFIRALILDRLSVMHGRMISKRYATKSPKRLP